MFITSKHTYFNYANNGKYIIGLGSNQEITDEEELFKGLIGICHYCLQPRTKSDIYDFLDKNHIEYNIFNMAIYKGFIVDKIVCIDDRYSRNHIYYQVLGYDFEDFQDCLSKKHILVIGAGGIGNSVCFFLNSIGVRKLTIIDPDIIECSNLTRQFLFRESDRGKLKVEKIREELLKINSSIEIDIFPEKLSTQVLDKVDRNVDLVVLSADDRYCRKMTNDFCIEHSIPVIIAGYMNDISIIGPFFIPKLETSCLSCISSGKISKENDKIDDIFNNYKAPSVYINNFFTGAMLASEILKFFAEDYDSMLSINKMVGIHNRTMRLETRDIVKNNKCLCSLKNGEIK